MGQEAAGRLVAHQAFQVGLERLQLGSVMPMWLSKMLGAAEELLNVHGDKMDEPSHFDLGSSVVGPSWVLMGTPKFNQAANSMTSPFHILPKLLP